jgi:hypothetical protein
VAAALSDEAWAKICKAAGRPPDAEARAALTSLLLDEYPAFAYDRKRVEAALLRSKRMLKRLAAFEADYRVQFPSDVWKTDRHYENKRNIAIKTERDLSSLEVLRRRVEAVWLVACAIRRANKGQGDQQREWLYHRLCGIWLDHFHGETLTVTVPPWGGPPEGPLIEFVLAAMRQIMPRRQLPKSTESVRYAIERERKERDRAAQLWLDLRQPK